jgi:hypothetical protein
VLRHELAFPLQGIRLRFGGALFGVLLLALPLELQTALVEGYELGFQQQKILEEFLDHYLDLQQLLAFGEEGQLASELILEVGDALLLGAAVDDLAEGYDGGVVQLALLWTGDGFNVVDF